MDNQKLFSFDQAKIMAVINLTPDSYHAESRAQNHVMLARKVENAIREGADWIDLGAVSTRPGSAFVSLEEERKRLIHHLASLIKEFPETPFSIDTFRYEIAREAYENGAAIVNDVSNGQSLELLKFVAENDIPYVLMHMRGTPNNMMENTHYDDVVEDVLRELKTKLDFLASLGLKRVIVDPGFGFSKTLEQNYMLLKRLDRFGSLQKPIMVGISRKSMIYKLLGTTASDALNGTTVLHTIALLKGAKILRVHDVKEAVECRTIVNQIQ
jgi:dihydropteroate synthase